MHAHRTISEHNDSAEIEVTSDDESDDSSGGEEEIEFEDDIVYLRSLDPKVGSCLGCCWMCKSRWHIDLEECEFLNVYDKYCA